MKHTKYEIEIMAKEVMDWLTKKGMTDSVCIYWNNKRWCDGKLEDGEFNPHDYFNCADDHILSMSFEGYLYDCINGYGKEYEQLEHIFAKHGAYFEQYDSWNLSVYPDDDNEWDFTKYEVKPEPIVIFSKGNPHSVNTPIILEQIKEMWDTLSLTTESLGGSCVLGDGFEFDYKGTSYKMVTPNIQGSLSYEHWIPHIKGTLKAIGCENVYYHYGRMD